MHFQITTVIGCSVNCTFCPQGKLREAFVKVSHDIKDRVMSMDTFKDILSKIPKNNVINFCGFSEPFQNPHCTEMILYAHRQGYQIAIYTTLMHLKLENAKLLFKEIPFKEKSCNFVIHLPSKKVWENINVNKSYLEVLEFIIKSKRNILFHYHRKELNEVVEKLLDKHHIKAQYIPANNRAGNLKNSELVAPERKTGNIICNCWSHVILPDGTTVVCPHDYGLKYVLGNIKRESFKKVMTSPVKKNLISAFQNDKVDTLCRFCPDSVSYQGQKDIYKTFYAQDKKFTGYKIFFNKKAKKIYLVRSGKV